jgi:hypothetical protein
MDSVMQASTLSPSFNPIAQFPYPDNKSRSQSQRILRILFLAANAISTTLQSVTCRFRRVTNTRTGASDRLPETLA